MIYVVYLMFHGESLSHGHYLIVFDGRWWWLGKLVSQIVTCVTLRCFVAATLLAKMVTGVTVRCLVADNLVT